MCTVLCPLCGIRQKWQRKLQLGCMLYVLYICYAVASVFVVVAALQIYIKMNTGEDGVVKSIVSLVGACLFIIGASIVFPAFFGYRI